MKFCVQLVDIDPELKTTSNETFKCNTIERFLSINNKRNYKRDLSISANHKYYTNVTQNKTLMKVNTIWYVCSPVSIPLITQTQPQKKRRR